MKSLVKIIKLQDYDFEKVSYYTLQFEGDSKTQFDQFLNEYTASYELSIHSLQWWLTEIGEHRGAIDRFFRVEDNVKALPPPARTIKAISLSRKGSNDLRLYCIVLTEEIVILVNGGIKESDAARDSPSCWKQLMFASNIATQIKRQLVSGKLKTKGKKLTVEKDFKLEYQRKN